MRARAQLNRGNRWDHGSALTCTPRGDALLPLAAAGRHSSSFGSAHRWEQITAAGTCNWAGLEETRRCVAQCFGLEGVFQQEEVPVANLPMRRRLQGWVAWSAQP